SPGLNNGSTGFSRLRFVACANASDCWAVGIGNANSLSLAQTLTEHWNGNTWTIVASPNANTQNNTLFGVTCLSTSNCFAVGYHDGSAENTKTLIEHWDGNAWSLVSAPNAAPFASNFLFNVSCVSASQCWAAGYSGDFTTFENPMLQQWNGSSWSLVA